MNALRQYRAHHTNDGVQHDLNLCEHTDCLWTLSMLPTIVEFIALTDLPIFIEFLKINLGYE